jgi:hypothetical protein
MPTKPSNKFIDDVEAHVDDLDGFHEQLQINNHHKLASKLSRIIAEIHGKLDEERRKQ